MIPSTLVGSTMEKLSILNCSPNLGWVSQLPCRQTTSPGETPVNEGYLHAAESQSFGCIQVHDPIITAWNGPIRYRQQMLCANLSKLIQKYENAIFHHRGHREHREKLENSTLYELPPGRRPPYGFRLVDRAYSSERPEAAI